MGRAGFGNSDTKRMSQSENADMGRIGNSNRSIRRSRRESTNQSANSSIRRDSVISSRATINLAKNDTSSISTNASKY